MAHVGEKDNLQDNSGLWWDGFPATALLFFSVFIGLMLWTRRHKHLPPGPFFPLRLLSDTNSQKRYLIFIKYAQEYGPIYCLRFGNSLTVVLGNISLAKEALVEKAEVFSERFVTKAIQIGSRGLKGRLCTVTIILYFAILKLHTGHI